MKNKLALLFTFLFVTSGAFCLPGVIQTIPDQSGQFVYYRDTSFQRESYFGIVYYDEGTYGVRYFAPAVTNVTPLLPKKDIQILFSLDPLKKHIDLTGERILTSVTPEDTDIVNYLHDMIYELNSHRQKAGVVEEEITLDQEYQQFGGYVNITYQSLIPLFNIKSIKDAKGSSVFYLVTQGQLTSSQDDTFKYFEGLPLKTEDTNHSLKLNKKAKKQKIEYKKLPNHSQKMTLDNQWTPNAENLWMLKDMAVIAFDIIDLSSVESDAQKNLIINNLYRRSALGTNASYPYSELFSKTQQKNNTSISNLFYNDESKSFTKDYKCFTKLDDNTYGLMTMTVFYAAWKTNSKYFESIIKSYSAD